jgi:hypothetical protein
MNPTLSDLARDEARVIEVIDRMVKMTKDVDSRAADAFVNARNNVRTGVVLFRLGPGNPVKSVPAYVDLGGEA